MRRYRLLALSTMVGVLAVASPASAERVFTVEGAQAPGPACYDRVRVIEQGPRGAGRRPRPGVGHFGRRGTHPPGGARHRRPACRAGRCGPWTGARICWRRTRCSVPSSRAERTARPTPFRYYLGVAHKPVHHPALPRRLTERRASPAAAAWAWRSATCARVIRSARKGRPPRRTWPATRSAPRSRSPTPRGTSGAAQDARDLAGLVLIDGGSGGTPIRPRPRRASSSSSSPPARRSSTSAGFGSAVGARRAQRRRLDARGAGAGRARHARRRGRRCRLRCARRWRQRMRPATATRSTTTPRPPTSRWCTCTSAAWPRPAVTSSCRSTRSRPRLGPASVLKGARALARRSHLPRRMVTLVDRHSTYDHIDPLSALPAKNAFVKTVVPFLRRAR